MSASIGEDECSNESLVERYQRLRKALQRHAQDIYEFIWAGNESHVLLLDLGEVIRDLEDNTFKIGLFGVTAAGKSTLTNALLRDSILREGLGETTRTLTRICAPDSNHPHGTVVIQYKTLEALHQDLNEHLITSGFGFKDGLRVDMRDPAFRAELRAIVRNNKESESAIDITCRYIRHLLDGWDRCEAHLGSELVLTIEESDQLLHDEEDIPTYIRERVVHHDNNITRNGLTFFDAPGIGSSYARHTQEAVNLARRVDAAILVTKIDYKFMPPDRRFVRDALDVQRMQERHNLVFVLNQISRINPFQSNPPRPLEQFDECVGQEVARLRERLAEVGIDQATVFPIDAACGRWTRRYLDDPRNEEAKYNFKHYSFVHCKGDPSANLEASRLMEFESELVKHLTSIRYHSFLGNKLDRLTSVNQSYEKECSIALAELKLTLGELEKELVEHRANGNKVGELLHEYLHIVMPAEVEEIYQGLSGRISQIVEHAFQILTKTFMNRSKWVELNPEAYWAQVVEESRPEIETSIAEIRNELERKYNSIKIRAVQERIPQILSHYGREIDWTLVQKDLSVAIRFAIQGLSRIRLDQWQEAKAFFFSGFRFAKDRYKKLVLEYLRENFDDDFREDFCKNIRGWVDADQKWFSEQIFCKFSTLMNQIEDRISAGISIKKAKEPERRMAEDRLVTFLAKSAEVKKALHELEQEIENARLNCTPIGPAPLRPRGTASGTGAA